MDSEPGQAVMGTLALDAVAGRPDPMMSGRRDIHLSLLFEDLPAGIRAKIALDQLALSMEPAEVNVHIRKWSFSSLQDREPCEWAVNEGMRAQVLWLAMQGQRDLSQFMSDYVAAWMEAGGKGKSRAAVLSFDPNLDCALRRDRVLHAMSRIEKNSDAAVFVDFGNTPTAVWKARIARIATGAAPVD